MKIVKTEVKKYIKNTCKEIGITQAKYRNDINMPVSSFMTAMNNSEFISYAYKKQLASHPKWSNGQKRILEILIEKHNDSRLDFEKYPLYSMLKRYTLRKGISLKDFYKKNIISAGHLKTCDKLKAISSSNLMRLISITDLDDKELSLLEMAKTIYDVNHKDAIGSELLKQIENYRVKHHISITSLLLMLDISRESYRNIKDMTWMISDKVKEKIKQNLKLKNADLLVSEHNQLIRTLRIQKKNERVKRKKAVKPIHYVDKFIYDLYECSWDDIPNMSIKRGYMRDLLKKGRIPKKTYYCAIHDLKLSSKNIKQFDNILKDLHVKIS